MIRRSQPPPDRRDSRDQVVIRSCPTSMVALAAAAPRVRTMVWIRLCDKVGAEEELVGCNADEPLERSGVPKKAAAMPLPKISTVRERPAAMSGSAASYTDRPKVLHRALTPSDGVKREFAFDETGARRF